MKLLKKILLIGLISVLIAIGYTKYHNMNINDVGLAVLGWVKKVKGDTVDINNFNKEETPVLNHQDWNALLQKHVSETGQVSYKGFKEDSANLQQYLDALSKNGPGSNWTEKQRLAYWINAYNAFTVKLIIDNYPLKSIKDIGDGLPMIDSPWDIKFFKIGGVDFDLNTIEHVILRKQFKEPRIHFAVNCASFSCPKLRNEAYFEDQLDAQLTEQSKAFLNNVDKNKITESETKLSKIFNWFASDFGGSKGVLKFIEKHKPAINKNNKVEYLEYGWTLNE